MGVEVSSTRSWGVALEVDTLVFVQVVVPLHAVGIPAAVRAFVGVLGTSAFLVRLSKPSKNVCSLSADVAHHGKVQILSMILLLLVNTDSINLRHQGLTAD